MYPKIKLRLSTRSLLALLLTLLSFAVYYVATRTDYLDGFYGFHDTGLINDWITNTLRGKPFHITHYGWNHLSKHFTPSLLLLLPFYLVTDSQFVLLFLSCIAIAWTALELWTLAVQEFGIEADKPALLWSVFFLCFALVINPFVKSVLLIGHFEIFFLPLALRVASIFIYRGSTTSFYIWLLVAVGVRQDAALFLSSMLLGIFLHLRRLERAENRLKPMLIGIFFLAFYFLLSVKVFMPMFGSEKNLEFWASWGQSYGEIFWNILSQPSRAAERLFLDSGLVPLLISVALFPLFTFPSFAVAHSPAILMYMMDSDIRRYLTGYSSGLLLPSVFLFSILGIANLLRFSAMRQSFVLKTIGIIGFVWGAVMWPYSWQMRPVTSFRMNLVGPSYNAPRQIWHHLKHCDSNLVLASDFRTFAYLPLDHEKYLLTELQKADIVVFNPNYDRHLPYNFPVRDLERRLSDLSFKEVVHSPHLIIFARSEAGRACASGG